MNVSLIENYKKPNGDVDYQLVERDKHFFTHEELFDFLKYEISLSHKQADKILNERNEYFSKYQIAKTYLVAIVIVNLFAIVMLLLKVYG
jgi:hypothetical protein